jgi:hypothetical protein
MSISVSLQSTSLNKDFLNMGGHHLILGKIPDFITGEIIDDSLDERYRQQIAQGLVNQKGYSKEDIISRQKIFISAGKNQASIFLDFQVAVDNLIGVVIKYGPGSIVTRRRPALSFSRIVRPYQVPIVVVTNGQEAEILDGCTGKIISLGIENIPTKSTLKEIVSSNALTYITKKRFEMESRILYAYEVDGSCPCDDTICRI